MSIEEFEARALKLDPRSRARLAGRLLESLETLSPAENAQVWAEEALRRDAELRSDPSRARRGREVFRAARARFG
ncbi:MAG: addiction module protein [Planctomycetota bacterium]